MKADGLDSSGGLGMTGSGVGWLWKGAMDWWGVGHSPLDPSTGLRVSGPGGRERAGTRPAPTEEGEGIWDPARASGWIPDYSGMTDRMTGEFS